MWLSTAGIRWVPHAECTLELTRATSRGMCVARCFPAINAGAVRPLSLPNFGCGSSRFPAPLPKNFSVM